ncbi:helix-turn-helix domain-containing protein [Prosthecodimorpha staleyi]|uniref:Helix-turn-helix domain-containing protein n=1 Tax=Prosthecodimorpha staleyi TaxID=2840188 RepID=A0A947D133_9HYPH|nr:helix-turn-helix domain-containing protein [Prosthecodimorpha staleyi]MBT9288308.1 helix-turn-helix domain-containing protein [Prosthecodimorpha staleyi]
MSKFGETLVEAAREALAVAEGRAEPARIVTVEDIDVKAIRLRLKMSQDAFAAEFGLSPATVRDWEQGRRKPDGPARTLLRVIASEPDAVRRAARAS